MAAVPEPTAPYPLFDGLSTENVVALATLAQRVKVAAGEVLFRLGDPADRFFVVVDGTVVLTMPVSIRGALEETFVDEIAAGHMFGWSAFVPPNRYTTSARAGTDCTLLVYRAADLQPVFSERPEVGLAVYRNMAALVCQRFYRVQAMWLRGLERNIKAQIG